ncbi:MAG: sensor histidine kinase [Streptosporangiaceae bacterium]
MRAVRIPGGIRLIDIAATAIVIAAVELNIATADGSSQHPLNAVAYTAGVLISLPVLFRNRWPLRMMLSCSLLLVIFYIADRRNISPAPLLTLPLYDAAAAGFLAWAIIVPVFFMVVGFFVTANSLHESLSTLAANFLLPFAVLFLAVALGEVVRSRRALAAETADRLRIAAEEREGEAARRVAEERLRIARDLHDTIAHSMATITVQAGSALHVLDGADDAGSTPDGLRDSLAAIRETSKTALTDIRATLGRLRREDAAEEGGLGDVGGIDRLPALADAVTEAGAPVTLTIEGERVVLPAAVDQAAYRILQESLTNVLRHAGPEACASVRLTFGPGALTIRVSDDGGPVDGRDNGRTGPGHGITGMTERAVALGGELTAGPGAEGGFEIVARLPTQPAGTPA